VESPRLRVTSRCLRDDFKLDEDRVADDARAYCSVHQALRTFVARREGEPGGGEIAKGMQSLGVVRTLHVGRGRGVTAWDPDNDVCWLLAYEPVHAIGEHRDAYKLFERLDARGELMPTVDDYLALDVVTTEALLDGLATIASDLYFRARSVPGEEAHAEYEDRHAYMVIDLVVEDDGELEEGWLAITFPRDTGLDHGAALDLVSRLLPEEIDWESLRLVDQFRGRPAAFTELVFNWTR
jgi:hypothetical protein